MSANATTPKARTDKETDWWYKSALFCFCIAVNYIGSVIAFNNSYHFLFLDMIGTFVAAVVFGPIFAIATALLTNTLTSLFTEANLVHFAFANAAGGLWWAFAAQRGWLAVLQPMSPGQDMSRQNMVWRSARLILLGGGGACLVVSSVAVFLKTYVFAHNTASFGDYIYRATAGPELFRAFIADLLLSLPDKVLVAIAGCVMVQAYLRFTDCQIGELEKRDRQRLAAANTKDLWLLGASLFAFLVVLAWRHIQFSQRMASPHGFLTVAVLFLLLLAAILFFAHSGWATRSRHATRDLFNAQLRCECSKQAAWFSWSLCALPLTVVLYWLVFVWLGKTPWGCYAENPWPIAPSWTAIPALVVLAIAQVLIIRVNEDRAAELERSAQEETEGIVSGLARELQCALSGANQTAQELATGWETNEELLDYVEGAVRDARHEPGNWHGQVPPDGEPFNEAELTFYQRVVDFVKKRLAQHYDAIVKMFDFTKTTLPVGDVAAYVGEIVADVRAAAACSSYVRLSPVEVDPSVEKVSADKLTIVPSSLRAVLRGLLSNSVQAIENSYRNCHDSGFRRDIVVTVSFDGRLNITVKDEGGGFPDAVLADIYVSRVLSSKKRIGGAPRYGEGSMIVSRFVKMMHGTIRAENWISPAGNPGASTTVSFPLSPSEY